MILRYDGTDFAGWQRQRETPGEMKSTIQSTLEKCLSQIFERPIKTVASGRTDAGVHAEAQVVHFDVPAADKRTEPEAASLNNVNLLRALNAMLPKSIAVTKAFYVPDDFHALFSTTAKTYRYLIYNSVTRDPFRMRYSTWVQKPLDIEKLGRLSQTLIGEHDFKSFQTSGTEVKSTIRRIDEARWSRLEEHLIEFRITGSGFLKQMVRNIVGTLLYLHQNDGTPPDMAKILESRDRTKAKMTAPPQGLYLHAVYYPPELDKARREL